MLRSLIFLKDKKPEVNELLKSKGFEIKNLSDISSLLEFVTKENYHLIILQDVLNNKIDLTISQLKELDPRMEVIIIGDKSDVQKSISTIKSGATAYLTEPVNIEELTLNLDKVIETMNMRRETGELEKHLYSKYIFQGMVSRNPVMLDIFSLVKRIAPYYKNVLFTGPTGTGKEMLAKALHNLSPSSTAPFIIVNCGGLVETLIESELFGHIKGTFTGAVSDKVGLFEAAGEGAIFLDEVDKLPISYQSHFLRVLSGGEFRRIGSTRDHKAKCRIIAATNKNLLLEVHEGRFREDLYYRLNVIEINLPPLKDRKDDIPFLIKYFLEKFSKERGKNVFGVSRPAQQLLMSYDWPGNIRELANILERSALITTEPFIRVQDLPPAFLQNMKDPYSKFTTLKEMTRKHIKYAMIMASGNKSKAAELLGISRFTLLRDIKKYQIEI